MQNSSPPADARHDSIPSRRMNERRKKEREGVGRALVAVAPLACAAVLLIQILHATGTLAFGFADWRPVLYAYLLWGIAYGVGQVVIRGERGLRALFLLPAVLFTVAVVVFPTIFGFYI